MLLSASNTKIMNTLIKYKTMNDKMMILQKYMIPIPI